MRARRIGLACALGRPVRVERFLARRGIALAAVVRGPDHGPVPAGPMMAKTAEVDLWLATAKCALHLPDDGRTNARVATLDYELALSPGLRERLRAVGRLDRRIRQQ